MHTTEAIGDDDTRWASKTNANITNRNERLFMLVRRLKQFFVVVFFSLQFTHTQHT